jgi:hypothetical protein
MLPNNKNNYISVGKSMTNKKLTIFFSFGFCSMTELNVAQKRFSRLMLYSL